MRFRPCIDIHNGKVKQIVGGSLREDASGSEARENYVSGQDGAFYGEMYRRLGLAGGHIILLNAYASPEYVEDLQQARGALRAYPGGLMIGGGVTEGSAMHLLTMGASHVIVTSWLFPEGRFSRDRLERLAERVGREHLVIDLSCRRRDGSFYVVTDRWQTFTDAEVTPELLRELEGFCDEFLVHGVDREGLGAGMDEELVRLLAEYAADGGRPVTYAGGIGSLEDLLRFREISGGVLDVTVGSALEMFGGKLRLEDVLEACETR
ncbi:MAG: phosphoribosylformimino-5-aminoimidazole carboxamide ribotide isomerase [Lachnospiraceae bacterium]|nr:phosphoribosylformimino-5-aminoimidazole carboxamide ribotide isomerase [Lachnospiraceae bacterium]